MSLIETIKSNIIEAMKAKDTVRLTTLRGVTSACTNELVSKGKKPQDILTDEEVVAVITRLAKQRKDSIEQFTKGGRADLADSEEAELAVLEKYLPKLMEREEVEARVKSIQSELGITEKSDAGKLIAKVMQELKGKADGAMVKSIIDEIFS